MKARASLSIFKRFGLSSIISDFLISLFAFFVGMFVTVAASNPGYGMQYRNVASEYGDNTFVIDPWASISRPSANNFLQRFFFLDSGIEADLKEQGVEYEKFYYVSNPTQLFNGNSGFYAMPKSLAKYLPVSVKHGEGVNQAKEGAQLICELYDSDEYQLGDKLSISLSDFEGKSLFEFDAKIVASNGETSFWRGDSYNVCYFDDAEFASLERVVLEDSEHFFGETEIDHDGSNVVAMKGTYARPYILAHMNEAEKKAFSETRDAKLSSLKAQWPDAEIASGMDSFRDIYDLWCVQNGSGFNNVGHYPYLLISAIASLLIIIVGQTWLSAEKHRKDSAVAIIVGATKKEIITAHFAKKIIDVALIFVLGWFATYFLDYHAKSFYWPKEFSANIGLYWVFCLIVGAVSLISLLLKVWELRGLDFAEAIRRDN